MKLRDFTIAALVAAVLFVLPGISQAGGHIASSGVTEEGASQLVVWYDESDPEFAFGDSFLQVTNLSTDTGVNIHVQIFADNADGPELCREHDFTDTLTPTDTVLYIIGELDSTFTSNGVTFGGNNAHAPIAIDVDVTRGFIVITAVNQVTLPRQAISHNYLIGTMGITGLLQTGVGYSTRFNAQGRQAVDFSTGALAAAGTVLDGVSTGLRLIQPSILNFMFDDTGGEPVSYINSITFSDTYSDPNGEYRATPDTVVWDPIIFDDLEIGTSCEQHVNTCFVAHGVNDFWQPITGAELCPASDVDDGWATIAVSGLSGLSNTFGLASYTEFNSPNFAYGNWMHTE